ncbi:MAG TPA: T9SS type A sorting domain-containing protein [Chitinophagales bacterium]|nr:T9SS type A sorting domain-containing protein [Chitinophagales bacterium]HRK28571.1 T9SS type A sorting domain-containing protein [Chitinophagales bacterium]
MKTNNNTLTNYLIALVLCLLGLTMGAPVAFAQTEDPCEIGGYILSATATDATCYGANNGTATVASTGCNCVFSGCLFLWQDGQQTHTAVNLTAGVYGVTITHPNGCIMDTTVVVGEPSVFVSGISAQAPHCLNGSDGGAEVIPTAVAGPLTYLWSNGATTAELANVPAGTYGVTVTNFIGCEYVSEVTIEEPAAPVLTTNVQKSCLNTNNGSATVTVSGGVAPFTYRWNDPAECPNADAHNLAPGAYTVIVTDANGCEYAATATVEAYDPINYSLTVQPSCTGANTGSVSVLINGAAQFPLIYYWNGEPVTGSPGSLVLNDLAPGSYELVIADGVGCNQTQTLTIPSAAIPATVTASAASVCSGTTVQLTAAGGTAYAWAPDEGLSNLNIANPTATPTQTTTYVVQVTTDAGCQSSGSVTVTVQPAPIPSINAWNTTLCAGQSTQMVTMVPGGATSFSWSPAASLNNPASNAPIATPAQTTTYTVVVTNAAGCTGSAQVTLTVEDCTGIQQDLAQGNLQIYPNPGKGFFSLQVPQTPTTQMELSVFSIDGKLAHHQVINTPAGNMPVLLNLSDVSPGLYFVTLQNGNIRYTEKLIIR